MFTYARQNQIQIFLSISDKYTYNHAYRICRVKFLQKDNYVDSCLLNYVYVFKYFTVLFKIMRINNGVCNSSVCSKRFQM